MAFLLALFFSQQLLAADYCDQTQLYQYMDEIKTELKSMAFEVKKQKYAVVNQRIERIVELLDKSKQETPFLFTNRGLSGELLAKKQQQYQDALSDTIGLFAQLKNAVEKQSGSDIKQIMQKIGKARKLGHRQFKAKC